MVVHMLPKGVGFIDSLQVSGKLGRLNVITTGFEKGNGFDGAINIIYGVGIGGFFLAYLILELTRARWGVILLQNLLLKAVLVYS